MDEHNQANETELNILSLLKGVIDPELGINIIDLGLIYEISFSQINGIKILLTLSSKGCPMGDVIIKMIEEVLETHYPQHKRQVELTWEPAWTTDRITEQGRHELNML
ncbi:MAG: metal-sulfur cluster assembly factor [Bacteroidetes bacterium]|nr:metal-sulfur cluster assembly factor [Bacteroidota bacterium]